MFVFVSECGVVVLRDVFCLYLYDRWTNGTGYLGWNGPVLVTPPNNRVTTAPDTTNQRNILYEALRNYLINPKSLNTLLETLMNDHNYAVEFIRSHTISFFLFLFLYL